MSVLSRLSKPTANVLRFMQKQPPVRHGGHGPRKLEVTPSRWDFWMSRDYLHFYTVLLFGPLVAISAYTSIVIGNAQLAPIPEGYEPEEYEYERNPITRFFVKRYPITPQMSYEVEVHERWDVDKSAKQKSLLKEVKRLMAENGDYAGWYYKPQSARFARANVAERVKRVETRGWF